MKSKQLLSIIIFLFVLSSCTKKRYEDYNKNSFYESQGIITSVNRTNNVFDNTRVVDIEYSFFSDEGKFIKGSDENIDLALREGEPIVVLVHKDDYSINFYGYNGVINLLLLQKGYSYLKE